MLSAVTTELWPYQSQLCPLITFQAPVFGDNLSDYRFDFCFLSVAQENFSIYGNLQFRVQRGRAVLFGMRALSYVFYKTLE
jgi:hypothetical protein